VVVTVTVEHGPEAVVLLQVSVTGPTQANTGAMNAPAMIRPVISAAIEPTTLILNEKSQLVLLLKLREGAVHLYGFEVHVSLRTKYLS
jgi:hypothetical protein